VRPLAGGLSGRASAAAPTGVCGLIGAPAFDTEVAFDMNSILVCGRTIRGIVERDSVP
jgi:aryl-alcohol dehydrogenase